jgi:hypothetical protein
MLWLCLVSAGMPDRTSPGSALSCGRHCTGSDPGHSARYHLVQTPASRLGPCELSSRLCVAWVSWLSACSEHDDLAYAWHSIFRACDQVWQPTPQAGMQAILPDTTWFRHQPAEVALVVSLPNIVQCGCHGWVHALYMPCWSLPGTASSEHATRCGNPRHRPGCKPFCQIPPGSGTSRQKWPLSSLSQISFSVGAMVGCMLCTCRAGACLAQHLQRMYPAVSGHDTRLWQASLPATIWLGHQPADPALVASLLEPVWRGCHGWVHALVTLSGAPCQRQHPQRMHSAVAGATQFKLLSAFGQGSAQLQL